VFGQYPITIKMIDTEDIVHEVGGGVIVREDNYNVSFTIPLSQPNVGIKQIILENWSKENYPSNIYYFYTNPKDISVSSRFIKSLSTTTEYKTDGANISYNAISNTGDIEIQDERNGEVLV
ncbi:MAG: hypothetical protein KBS91_03955, partial [Firmicutes bacterium]|nr:hypothetical protein [Candidatus Caballimonas caccae]